MAKKRISLQFLSSFPCAKNCIQCKYIFTFFRLNKLWEDIDANWMHRETFVHSNFRGNPHENYQSISNETLRAFEVRWLDLRILGLIEQREHSLAKLKELNSKRYNKYDCILTVVPGVPNKWKIHSTRNWYRNKFNCFEH